ncbi:mycothiol system anti-sigma-R factor [Haloglycomyces albus]|uniref:mycothiol system anti-sigma-R factor n=1 Tax=Haloglycomyces albus TaxID=526067 RepID=UPI00046D0767|nr:mycothiol system anti-sigma-R factor [Haloglycomyces albus]
MCEESKKAGQEDCGDVIEAVYLYLDNECSESRRTVIRQHLEECSPCLSEYGIEQEVRTLVHRCCSQEKAPDEVKDRLKEKLAAIDKVGDSLWTEERERASEQSET